MNKIKIFRTSSRDLINYEERINSWATEEKVSILQISSVGGESYSTFGSRVEDKELFLIVLYAKIKEKKDNKKQT